MGSENGLLEALEASIVDVEAGELTPTLGGLTTILENYRLDETVWLDGGTFEDLPWNFALVPPTLALAIVPDQVAYFTVFPNSAGSISIQIGYLLHPRVLEMPLFDVLFAQAKADVDNFNGADIHADTMVQVGLRSRFAPRGPYSWQEATLQQINRWLVKRYREHSRRDPAAARAAGL